MQIIILLSISISLSMDAFSLSLAYGTLSLSKKYINLLSSIVGIYHFFMPLIGLFIGKAITSFIKISPDIIVFIVLLFIGIEMIIESFKKEDKVKLMKISELILFGLAVSIDSFSVGIGLNALHINPLICAVSFSVCSYLFTYLGLKLGKKISSIIGSVATLIGGTILIIIGIMYAI